MQKKTFQQTNHLKHTAKDTMEKDFHMLEWPSQSPNLKQSENLWKRRLSKNLSFWSNMIYST